MSPSQLSFQLPPPDVGNIYLASRSYQPVLLEKQVRASWSIRRVVANALAWTRRHLGFSRGDATELLPGQWPQYSVRYLRSTANSALPKVDWNSCLASSDGKSWVPAAEMKRLFDAEGRPVLYDVFFSVDRNDFHAAEKLQAFLGRHGMSVYLSSTMLAPTEDYSQEIAKAIRRSIGFVLIASVNAYDNMRRNRWVKKEVLYAMRHKKMIVPYLIDSEPMDDDNALLVESNNWIETHGSWWESRFRLLEAIEIGVFGESQGTLLTTFTRRAWITTGSSSWVLALAAIVLAAISLRMVVAWTPPPPPPPAPLPEACLIEILPDGRLVVTSSLGDPGGDADVHSPKDYLHVFGDDRANVEKRLKIVADLAYGDGQITRGLIDNDFRTVSGRTSVLLRTANPRTDGGERDNVELLLALGEIVLSHEIDGLKKAVDVSDFIAIHASRERCLLCWKQSDNPTGPGYFMRWPEGQIRLCDGPDVADFRRTIERKAAWRDGELLSRKHILLYGEVAQAIVLVQRDTLGQHGTSPEHAEIVLQGDYRSSEVLAERLTDLLSSSQQTKFDDEPLARQILDDLSRKPSGELKQAVHVLFQLLALLDIDHGRPVAAVPFVN